MSEPDHQVKPNLASIFLTCLISWMMLVPVVNQIHLNLGQNETGVLSFATIQKISPYTDYVKYLFLFLIPPLMTAIFFRVQSNWIKDFLQKFILKLTHPKIAIIIPSILVISWIIYQNLILVEDRGVPSWGNLITDSFHEGEYLGFLPTFLHRQHPFLHSFFVHGFGLNVLPSLIAAKLTDVNHIISWTRFLVILENMITSGGYFWVLWEITQSFKFKISRQTLFIIACLTFCLLEGSFFYIDGRRSALFLIQLALTIRYVKTDHDLPISRKILPVLIGFSLPISLLYVYDRALYFICVYLCVSVLILFKDGNLKKFWFIGSTLGLISGLTLLLGSLGLEQLMAIGSQVLYWVKYGKYISYLPLEPLKINFLTQPFGVTIFLQTSVLVYLLVDLKGKNFEWKSFIQNNDLGIILGSASFMYMRMMLDRSDQSHVSKGASITVLLGYYLILLVYQRLEPEIIKMKWPGSYQILLGTFLSMLIIAEPGFNLWNSATQFLKIPQELSKPDREFVQPDYLEAVTKLTPTIEQQSCFFTLTSEGLWYYLLDKPSCSKFSYLYYAKPTLAQNIVVDELKTSQPNLILFSNALWSNYIDGLSTANANDMIYRYVLQAYQPDQLIESHWFWRRRREPLTFLKNDSVNGFLDHIPNHVLQWGEPASISGWGILPQQNQPIDAVYLSMGEKNELIAVSSVNIERPDVALNFSNANYLKSGWSLSIPTYRIPAKKTRFRVWGYEAKTGHFIQIGNDIFLELVNTKN